MTLSVLIQETGQEHSRKARVLGLARAPHERLKTLSLLFSTLSPSDRGGRARLPRGRSRTPQMPPNGWGCFRKGALCLGWK